MKNGIILLGSSASKGETYQMCAFLHEKTGFPIIDKGFPIKKMRV
jgi:hypothetical protein